MAEHTEASTTVSAPPEAVLAVVADLPAYPEWNDEVRVVEVLARDAAGRPSRARFTVDAGVLRDTYVLDYAWSDRSVRWTLVEGTVLTRLDGSYELREVPGAAPATEVTYRLTVDVTIPMLGMLKRKAEKVLVDRALAGLKRRVETAGTGSR